MREQVENLWKIIFLLAEVNFPLQYCYPHRNIAFPSTTIRAHIYKLNSLSTYNTDDVHFCIIYFKSLNFGEVKRKKVQFDEAICVTFSLYLSLSPLCMNVVYIMTF